MNNRDVYLFIVFLPQLRLETQYHIHHAYLTFRAQNFFIVGSH